MAPATFNELIFQLRWFAGLVVVVCCGWGLIALALYLTRNSGHDLSLVIGVAAAISLILFLGLEYKHLLTRLSGLRPFSADPYGVKSALFFWLTGVPGLMFRSSANDDLATETDARPAAAEPQQTDGVREIIETDRLRRRAGVAAEILRGRGVRHPDRLDGRDAVRLPEASSNARSAASNFPVNCSSEVDPQSGAAGRRSPAAPAPTVVTTSTSRPRSRTRPRLEGPGWNSGDRVLVAKFLYELLNSRPNRLDVVVFKYPGAAARLRRHVSALRPDQEARRR